MDKSKERIAERDFSAFADFSELINSSLDLNFTLNNLILTCLGKFHASQAAIYLRQGDSYILHSIKGKNKDLPESFPINSNFDQLANTFPIIKPLSGREENLGIFCLGKRIDNSGYDKDDKKFIRLLLNIASTAIENSQTFKELKESNKELDYKVNQLRSLFDISKEFSGILSEDRIVKLLSFSLIGQLMVTEFAIILLNNEESNILYSKFKDFDPENLLNKLIAEPIKSPLLGDELKDMIGKDNSPVKLIIPMQIKGKTKGLILLGERRNRLGYSESDIEFAQSLAGIAIISLENASLVKEAIEKQKLEKELETAREIQKSLLPQELPESEFFEFAAYSESAKMVGGDYFDIIKLNDHQVLVAIGDVSGKGVQASLLMANLQAFLKSISKMNYPLNEASNLLNDLVSENTRMGNFITFFWGILDQHKMTFTFVNAGHNPPLMVRKGKLSKLKTGGMILGFMKTITPYLSETVQLEKGDIIILFTDGITEAMDNEYKEYTDERLEDLVSNLNINSTAGEILGNIKKDVLLHTKGNEQSDDITCLVMKVK